MGFGEYFWKLQAPKNIGKHAANTMIVVGFDAGLKARLNINLGWLIKTVGYSTNYLRLLFAIAIWKVNPQFLHEQNLKHPVMFLHLSH